jgi:hypothetical protein
MSQALAMSFRTHKLADDVSRFQLYTSHMEQSPDGSRFWRDMLMRKVVDACPDLLTIATARYNRRLEHTHSFDAFVAQTQSIIAEVSANETLRGPSRSEAAPQSSDRPDKRQRGAQKRRAETAEPPASKRSKPTQPLSTAEKEEWGKLATKYDRCAECGWHSRGQPHSSEDCKEKRSTLRNRFEVIRDLDKKGQDPNRRFRPRTK